MARTVNEAEHAVKRNQILDTAQRLIYSKGYEQMAIQDILGELKISKGAFYHYFDSKPALLEALVERMQQEALEVLLPIVYDPHLPALEKLQRFFDTAVQWKTAHKAMVFELVRIWYSDHNAIFRHKMTATLNKRIMPLLNEIFNQGIGEGVFNIAYPDQIGILLLSLIQGYGDAFAEAMLAPQQQGDELQRMERLTAAFADALERLLGVSSGCLHLIEPESLKEWFVAPGYVVASNAD